MGTLVFMSFVHLAGISIIKDGTYVSDDIFGDKDIYSYSENIGIPFSYKYTLTRRVGYLEFQDDIYSGKKFDIWNFVFDIVIDFSFFFILGLLYASFREIRKSKIPAQNQSIPIEENQTISSRYVYPKPNLQYNLILLFSSIGLLIIQTLLITMRCDGGIGCVVLILPISLGFSLSSVMLGIFFHRYRLISRLIFAIILQTFLIFIALPLRGSEYTFTALSSEVSGFWLIYYLPLVLLVISNVIFDGIRDIFMKQKLSK